VDYVIATPVCSGEANTEKDMAQATKLNEVVKLAVDSSWIELAIERYTSKGGTLTEADRKVLLNLSAADLEKLKAIEQQAVGGIASAATTGGGCGVYY